jgi:stage V sporulation protein AC
LEIQKKQYQEMVMRSKPKPPVLRNVFWAFVVGGLICAIGQGFINLFRGFGLPVLDAGTASSIVLVFFAALLTGLGVYDQLAKYGGAGTIVPITGFANSMVAPALEAKPEGLVLGVGARLFTIAGPILTFGFTFAWLAAILYYIFA